MEGEGPTQTEGMWSTVLEYQAMPSLRGEANDGWLFTFTTVHSSWKFHQLTAGQPLSRQPVRYGKGGRYGPSITYKITHTGSLSSSPPGKPPCWASSTACYIVNVHNHPSWATHARKAWPGTLVDPCLICMWWVQGHARILRGLVQYTEEPLLPWLLLKTSLYVPMID